MKMRAIAGLGLTALILGGTMVGCTHGGVASASSRSEASAIRQAALNAEKAGNALAKGDAIKAVSFAEGAVALRPDDSGYRMLLANAYLKAGRFSSAHTAFNDVLTLSPENGKAALNLALAQIAEGQWDAARKTLDLHDSTIPATDRGLAMALAGDPAAGAEVLIAAARSPGADAKTRQNLALALALSGRWQEARVVVGADLTPIEADKRIVEWAAFAQPTGAADQVAALLGVMPVKDPGLPVALALSAPAPVSVAKVDTVETFMPGRADAAVEAAAVASVEPVAQAVPVAASGPTFGARREIVQAIPVQAVVAKPAVATIAAGGAFKKKVAAAPAAAMRTPAKGDWYVQLGAYDSAAVARDAWGRAKRRYVGFSDLSPAGMAYKSQEGTFYRLSVGGFAREDAKAICKGYRARGGVCFVRAGAGDQVASWVKPGVQVASR